MPAKTSIYLSDEMIATLAARTCEEGERSALIARILDRYEEVCRRALPDLSVGDWRLICDSLNGVIHEPAAHVSVVWAGIEDSIRLDKLAAKYGVDGKALLRRLRGLSYAQEVALVDTAERFWAAVGRGENPTVPGESQK